MRINPLQELAAELVAHMDVEGRSVLIGFVQAFCHAAEAEGAGSWIWYICQAITEEINRIPPTGAEDPSRLSDQ